MTVLVQRMVVCPELADVLSRHHQPDPRPTAAPSPGRRLRQRERVWNPPMPLLFQRRFGSENRPITGQPIRELLSNALAGTGLTDASGEPLQVLPARFPEDLHHRRHHERHAAAHRPARRRPPGHQRHHGLQGRLPRRSHQRPPGVHRPPPGHCGPARNTAPRPTRNGTSSSAISSGAKSLGDLRPGIRRPPASTSTAA